MLQEEECISSPFFNPSKLFAITKEEDSAVEKRGGVR